MSKIPLGWVGLGVVFKIFRWVGLGWGQTANFPLALGWGAPTQRPNPTPQRIFLRWGVGAYFLLKHAFSIFLFVYSSIHFRSISGAQNLIYIHHFHLLKTNLWCQINTIFPLGRVGAFWRKKSVGLGWGTLEKIRWVGLGPNAPTKRPNGNLQPWVKQTSVFGQTVPYLAPL